MIGIYITPLKRTFALAACPTFDLGAARRTLVAVRLAVRAAHWVILHCANARTYIISHVCAQRNIQRKFGVDAMRNHNANV